MPTLLTLPAELRQAILAHALPDKNLLFKPWPRTIVNLLQICHRLRWDMGPVISAWSPLHYMPFPTTLAKFKAQTVELDGCIRSPKIERICIDLFHESEVDRILQTCFCMGEHSHSHPELIAAWANAVSHLSRDVKEVYLDVTPAPATKRNQHRLISNSFIFDRRSSKHFLSSHVTDVAELICAIDKHYECWMPIKLTGSLGVKSEYFLGGLRAKTGLNLEFVGTWITAEDGRIKEIGSAVKRLSQKQCGKKTGKEGQPNLYQELRQLRWSQETKWTYAKTADLLGETSLEDDLRAFAEFLADDENLILTMNPVRALQRALQHKMAKDMGLASGSEGEGDKRHVVVMKRIG